MADRVDRATRSRMMAAVRSRDTKPETILRRMLHAAGYRYRLHVADIAGRPDIVLPRFRVVIQVNGCFWHGHGCFRSRLPGTRQEFWAAKIGANAARDVRDREIAIADGWRHLTVWECALTGKRKLDEGRVVEAVSAFLEGSDSFGVLEPDSGEAEGDRLHP